VEWSEFRLTTFGYLHRMHHASSEVPVLLLNQPILILTVMLNDYCCLDSLLSYSSPVVLVPRRGHPCFFSVLPVMRQLF